MSEKKDSVSGNTAATSLERGAYLVWLLSLKIEKDVSLHISAQSLEDLKVIHPGLGYVCMHCAHTHKFALDASGSRI